MRNSKEVLLKPSILLAFCMQAHEIHLFLIFGQALLNTGFPTSSLSLYPTLAETFTQRTQKIYPFLQYFLWYFGTGRKIRKRLKVW